MATYEFSIETIILFQSKVLAYFDLPLMQQRKKMYLLRFVLFEILSHVEDLPRVFTNKGTTLHEVELFFFAI